MRACSMDCLGVLPQSLIFNKLHSKAGLWHPVTICMTFYPQDSKEGRLNRAWRKLVKWLNSSAIVQPSSPVHRFQTPLRLPTLAVRHLQLFTVQKSEEFSLPFVFNSIAQHMTVLVVRPKCALIASASAASPQLHPLQLLLHECICLISCTCTQYKVGKISLKVASLLYYCMLSHPLNFPHLSHTDRHLKY